VFNFSRHDITAVQLRRTDMCPTIHSFRGMKSVKDCLDILQLTCRWNDETRDCSHGSSCSIFSTGIAPPYDMSLNRQMHILLRLGSYRRFDDITHGLRKHIMFSREPRHLSDTAPLCTSQPSLAVRWNHIGSCRVKDSDTMASIRIGMKRLHVNYK
jgi:hypothetical protein